MLPLRRSGLKIAGITATTKPRKLKTYFPGRLLAQNIQVSAVATSLKPDSIPRLPSPEGPPSSWRR